MGDVRGRWLQRYVRAAGWRVAGAGRRPRTWPAAGTGLLGSMVVAQVLSGVRPAPIRLTSVVVVLLASSAVAFLAGRDGAGRALGAFGAAAGAGYAAEWIGVRAGVPFGKYSYTPLLRPQLGGVPVIVAVAWGGMGLAAHAVATAIVPQGGLARWAAGAFALTAWDLFLDPQMLRLGLWTWVHEGPYRGVPVSNFAGWLAVSLLVMGMIDQIAGRTEAAPPGGLVAIYGVMTAMETLAFAAVFEPPDRVVAAIGGIAMGTCAALAGRRRWPR
ncbi:carotenoid biosynthesis protein [Actinomadura livida]|uniref:Carotenoid biosynthesis protein n=1 Tax=Actinomadura livida TaxID=79909 RepID=A0A7W7IAX1_9ACTN|nr:MULTISPECIES: carotenoid biosynthesis protein [Actinomadura]MBB4773756.1 putative membrane protein [Actinomadura catellatispora]GGU10497.1 membrane protein [Actinomadura livida]